MNSTNDELKNVFNNTFQYAAFCESNFNRHIANIGAHLIENTFTSDLSIAEYCEQTVQKPFIKITAAVEDTITRAVTGWADHEDYIIALLFAVNAKSWEHYALLQDDNAKFRTFSPDVHRQYAEYYADRYHTLYNFVMDELYKGDENEQIRIKIFRALD